MSAQLEAWLYHNAGHENTALNQEIVPTQYAITSTAYKDLAVLCTAYKYSGLLRLVRSNLYHHLDSLSLGKRACT